MWVGHPDRRFSCTPSAWTSAAWGREDEAVMESIIGKPDGQARWEAYMFLLAVRQWVRPGLRGRITMVGDAEGILGSLTAFRSDDHVINDISKEMALVLAPLGFELEAIHIWGEENVMADDLSRICQGHAVPWKLWQVPEVHLAPRARTDWTFFLDEA